jgi:hypothetical protein
MDETEKKSELQDFALKVLYHLAEKENKSIADTCYELLKKSRAISEPVPVAEQKPRQATDDEIDSCLTLAEVAAQTRIYKQWLCNWATRHADQMKMKGKIRLWPAEAVQAAKDEYYGVSSRQAVSETKGPGKTPAEAEDGMGEDKHAGGDDGEHRNAGGQTDKGNGEQVFCNGEPVYLSGRMGVKRFVTWTEAMRCTGLSKRQLEAVINRKEVISGWVRIYPGE